MGTGGQARPPVWGKAGLSLNQMPNCARRPHSHTWIEQFLQARQKGVGGRGVLQRRVDRT